MNETIPTAIAAPPLDGIGFAGDHKSRVPDTSMLPGSEKAPAAGAALLKQAVRGAHDTIDQMAESATPVVRKLDENVAAAEGAVLAKAEQLRDTRDAWMEGLRGKVRGNPVMAVAAALALGAVIARMVR